MVGRRRAGKGVRNVWRTVRQCRMKERTTEDVVPAGEAHGRYCDARTETRRSTGLYLLCNVAHAIDLSQHRVVARVRLESTAVTADAGYM